MGSKIRSAKRGFDRLCVVLLVPWTIINFAYWKVKLKYIIHTDVYYVEVAIRTFITGVLLGLIIYGVLRVIIFNLVPWIAEGFRSDE